MKTITPFRITIILDDGKPVAQVESMERVTVEGEVLSQKLLPAEPLVMPLSKELLGEINAESLARIATLEAQIAAKDEAHTAALAAKDAEHQAVVDDLTAKLEKLTQQSALIPTFADMLAKDDIEGAKTLFIQELVLPEAEKEKQADLVKIAELKAKHGIE